MQLSMKLEETRQPAMLLLLVLHCAAGGGMLGVQGGNSMHELHCCSCMATPC